MKTAPYLAFLAAMGLASSVAAAPPTTITDSTTTFAAVVDSAGNLHINCEIGCSGGGGGGGNAAAGPTGSAVPSNGDYIADNVSGILTGISSSNPLPILGSVNVLQGGAATSLSNPIFVSPATGANFGGVVNVSSTAASGSTSATPNAFTTWIAQSNVRKGCSLQNAGTAVEYIFDNTTGSATPTVGASYQVQPGGSFNCSSPGIVIGDLLQIASSVASMPYVGGAQ